MSSHAGSEYKSAQAPSGAKRIPVILRDPDSSSEEEEETDYYLSEDKIKIFLEQFLSDDLDKIDSAAVELYEIVRTGSIDDVILPLVKSELLNVLMSFVELPYTTLNTIYCVFHCILSSRSDVVITFLYSGGLDYLIRISQETQDFELMVIISLMFVKAIYASYEAAIAIYATGILHSVIDYIKQKDDKPVVLLASRIFEAFVTSRGRDISNQTLNVDHIIPLYGDIQDMWSKYQLQNKNKFILSHELYQEFYTNGVSFQRGSIFLEAATELLKTDLLSIVKDVMHTILYATTELGVDNLFLITKCDAQLERIMEHDVPEFYDTISSVLSYMSWDVNVLDPFAKTNICTAALKLIRNEDQNIVYNSLITINNLIGPGEPFLDEILTEQNVARFQSLIISGPMKLRKGAAYLMTSIASQISPSYIAEESVLSSIAEILDCANTELIKHILGNLMSIFKDEEKEPPKGRSIYHLFEESDGVEVVLRLDGTQDTETNALISKFLSLYL